MIRRRWRRNCWSMRDWSVICGLSAPVAKNFSKALATSRPLPRAVGAACTAAPLQTMYSISMKDEINVPNRRSLHGRDGKAAAGIGVRLRPALGDDLGPGVEAHAVHAVLVEVGEARALPAAEAVVGDRHRDWHVDPDHPDLDPAGELARGVAVAGEDGHAVAVLVPRRQRQRLLEGLRAHDLQHRPEDLLVPGLHVRGDAVEQGGAEEEAVLVPGQGEAAAVDDQLGAFLHPDADVVLDPGLVRGGDHRAVV